jgi:hypothetical protein
MDWVDYLRDEAVKYRHLAETAGDPEELFDLAAVCEEAANNIEDYAGPVIWLATPATREWNAPVLCAFLPHEFRSCNH